MWKRLLKQLDWIDYTWLAVVFVYLCANAIWIYLDTSPPLWDMAGHSWRATLYAQWLSQGDLINIAKYATIYPPGGYLFTAFGFVLFGWNSDVPQLSQLVFVAGFALAVYALGIKVIGNKVVSLLSVVLALCYPMLAHFTRIYDLDFQQAALVTMSITALVYSERFTKRNWIIVFGIVVAATLLFKWTAVVFLVGPVLCYLPNTKQSWKHFIMAAVIALVLAMPWYALHADAIFTSIGLTRNNVFSVPYEQLWSFDNALFYGRTVVSGITWPLAVALLFGIAALIWKKQYRTLALLAAWVVLPYALMTFVLYSKEGRYFLSAYPALALATASLWLVASQRWQKLCMIIILVVVPVSFYIETSWHANLWPVHPGFSTTYGYREILPKNPRYGFTYPTQYHANLMQQVMEVIQQDRVSQEKSPVYVAIVPNSIFATVQQFQFAAALQGIEGIDYSISSAIDVADWETLLPKADYIVTKSGDQGPLIWGPELPDIAKAQRKGLPPFNGYNVIAAFTVHGIEAEPVTVMVYRSQS